ncbi:type II toxin-antitoxin system HicA family toxin [Stutzerimonas urumqiensis]|uniref:type II toxin-antitoxin system HicA family toxin n=1 Tax=Stutzerimonas urumqiensis TaxID=638269 RepID=UPI003BACBA83
MLYARRHGWAAARTNGGHLRLTKPGRQPVYTSSTPSDRRAVHNALARLARADWEFAQEWEEAEEVALG